MAFGWIANVVGGGEVEGNGCGIFLCVLHIPVRGRFILPFDVAGDRMRYF